MEIRVGFELGYAAVQPTPMVIMLSIHPSRFSDIVGTEVINGNPYPIASSRVYTAPITVESGYTVAISGLDAAEERVDTSPVITRDLLRSAVAHLEPDRQLVERRWLADRAAVVKAWTFAIG